MEISRDQAIELLKHLKKTETTVGVYFAACGGTAGTTMIARISEVSWRVVFIGTSSVLRFTLLQTRFEYAPITVVRVPMRGGLLQIEGLHMWLESGHWLFVCDVNGRGKKWLKAVANALEEQTSERAAVPQLSATRASSLGEQILRSA
jgi:hypothetical protein